MDNIGNVFSPHKQLKAFLNKEYYSINFKYEGVKINLLVHRLQAYQKFGNKLYEQGIEVRHSNGNSKDNSYDNIILGTRSENMMDIEESVRKSKASNANKKYPDELVLEIKEYYSLGHSYSDIMKKFNISSKGTISYIINNR